jgi:hypothetical protein
VTLVSGMNRLKNKKTHLKIKNNKVNNVKVGELEAETSYSLEELKEYIQEFTK